ncbi:uncharacterized protein BDR25DRAFT_52057 [Lindgomyces ingoldianus]|uniref:Uncharacterized protein n=1 Tax=Lindgomyces ingoldianus TaxID=673940 RepID=A0ACB6QNS0_9PLEO|nr:uncharacterized protein BDR25DRAFT_52057 [Lindgomyces ingoldianus]KAF2468664.1 hypothetical protein BDR25DRAFT_52057 [Lindgomyces ingoldianus]
MQPRQDCARSAPGGGRRGVVGAGAAGGTGRGLAGSAAPQSGGTRAGGSFSFVKLQMHVSRDRRQV